MTEFYSKKLLFLFKNPKNMGVIKNCDSQSMVGNPVCGDVMKVYLKIKKTNEVGRQEDYIKDIKFQTLGCAAAIATSSIVTSLAKGKTLKEALKIDKQMVAKELGGLPKVKFHCSILAVDALHEAINKYLNK